ncbi:MAG: vitamin K epoxide reductase family protein [Deltaproteobacteria bacterium]|nr:vitamin K epoxide reductase family protein [Deltaproteobacteria bacterium]
MTRPKNALFLVLMAVFASGGILFSGISSYDFIVHLDRQVHAITCSFIPGAGSLDTTGTSGCYAALMSPYSSIMRTTVWGGIPIALMSMSVFAYLLFRALDVLLGKKRSDPHESLFLVAASFLPVFMSVIYFLIAVYLVGAVCKLCMGIYIASAGVFVFAILSCWKAFRAQKGGEEQAAGAAKTSVPWSRFAVYFAEGLVFVAVPVLLYLALKPAYTEEMSRCGDLAHGEDKYGVRVRLAGSASGVPAVEVLDPLCPACKGFKERLEASGLVERLDLQGVLFPLDKQCNWMVSESLHPGACAVSEAVLCAGDRAPDVLTWSLEHNEELRELGALDAKAPPTKKGPPEYARVYARVLQEFPSLGDCVNKPAVRSRINKSLRWIVSNSLPVLTPQLYVGGRKLCDEDTDLGLEFSLSRLLETRMSMALPGATAGIPAGPAGGRP